MERASLGATRIQLVARAPFVVRLTYLSLEVISGDGSTADSDIAALQSRPL